MRLTVGLAATSALAAALLLPGCESLPGKPREADRPVPPDDVTGFAPLFSTNCAGCHGSDGAEGAARDLSSPVFQRFIGDAELRRVIRLGVPGKAMPAFSRAEGGPLTETQIDALVEGMRERWYPREWPPTVEIPPYSEAGSLAAGFAPGDPERGRAAFERFCGRCHGAAATGGPEGRSIVDPAYLALVSDQLLRTAVVCGRSDLGTPDYRSYVPGSPMAPQQVADVVAWIASHRTE